MNEIILQGKLLNRNKSGLISLTDIWRISGKDKNYKPVEWLSINATQEYIGVLVLKVGGSSLLESTKGRTGGTFAHWKIALSYASYLDPILHDDILDIYARYKASDATLATDIYEKSTPENQKWIDQRQKCIKTRHVETDVLKEYGVHTWGYEYCTNQTYKGILGAEAKDIKKERGLTKRSNLRDHMDEIDLANLELANLEFAGFHALKKIERDNVMGNKPCGKTCYDTAHRVNTIMSAD